MREALKIQNLRGDNVQQIATIQKSGLWVLAGFIVGFDSDDETIFDRQTEFIERTAITWAMAGVLRRRRRRPYLSVSRERAYPADSDATTNFSHAQLPDEAAHRRRR